MEKLNRFDFRVLLGRLGLSKLVTESQDDSVVDFARPYLGEPIDFKIGNKLVRNNFASFLSDSFATSMGDPLVQLAYIQYMDQKYDAGALNIIKQFMSQQDPYNSLNESEKLKLLNDYKSVQRHSVIYNKSTNSQNTTESDFSICDRIRTEFMKRGETSLFEVILNMSDQLMQVYRDGREVIDWEHLLSLDGFEAKKYLSRVSVNTRMVNRK